MAVGTSKLLRERNWGRYDGVAARRYREECKLTRLDLSDAQGEPLRDRRVRAVVVDDAAETQPEKIEQGDLEHGCCPPTLQ